jgi:hypothetical protein
MTFKYSFTFPIAGGNKLQRVKDWARQHAPAIEMNLPPQTPIGSESITIRLKSVEDRQALIHKLAQAPL